MSYMYKNWAHMGPLIALYVGLVLLCNQDAMSALVFWVWLQFPIYLIHEFEEHAIPGGFKAFVNKEIFHGSENTPLNDARIFWINIIGVWFFFPILAALSQLCNPVYGIYIVYFALFNASVHIIAFVAKRKYNPGLLASIFLNYPSGVYTLWLAHKEGLLDPFVNITGGLVAFFGHALMIAFAVYWYKTANIPSKKTS